MTDPTPTGDFQLAPPARFDTLSLDDILTITVTLDALLDTEDLRIPAQNLELNGPAQGVDYLFDSSPTPKKKMLRDLARAQPAGVQRTPGANGSAPDARRSSRALSATDPTPTHGPRPEAVSS